MCCIRSCSILQPGRQRYRFILLETPARENQSDGDHYALRAIWIMLARPFLVVFRIGVLI